MVRTRYVTTNLRFPEESYRELRYRARRRGTTLASLVRYVRSGPSLTWEKAEGTR